MARTDQWHDERTEVITAPSGPDQASDGYVDPDRTQVMSGIDAPDRDAPAHHEPVEQPTAFGAATVGGAVAASAMAGPERLHEPRDPRADDTVRMGDGPVPDETAIGRTDPEDGTEPTDTTEATEPAGTTRTTGTGPTAATGFFGAEQAEAFRDRWRDVQLRFVDDPQGAAGQARDLVTEAVEALTAALTAQRDGLGGDTDGAGADDTEQLRMTVRRYRDLLDRLLAI
ncbi:hypothetical protein O7623_28365 [Solwaraspora sp. WMMD791]|uniref:hypothetical protein n=1 Tax=Solwaraspora sp. WMMD791 TaxID=3016086 RepID=UPI002499EBDE|nr:hypothetical protein [Solwaraspora sp. WMMD791]WFE27119.1 hypothetical protein O7623_28365 [Solwaraspora sp. WMMD791]